MGKMAGTQPSVPSPVKQLPTDVDVGEAAICRARLCPRRTFYLITYSATPLLRETGQEREKHKEFSGRARLHLPRGEYGDSQGTNDHQSTN